MSFTPFYHQHLQSEGWKKIRDMRIHYDDNRCRNCGATINLQVHHTNYSNLGNEDIKQDLATLCIDCHNKITRLNRRRRKIVTEFG